MAHSRSLRFNHKYTTKSNFQARLKELWFDTIFVLFLLLAMKIEWRKKNGWVSRHGYVDWISMNWVLSHSLSSHHLPPRALISFSAKWREKSRKILSIIRPTADREWDIFFYERVKMIVWHSWHQNVNFFSTRLRWEHCKSPERLQIKWKIVSRRRQHMLEFRFLYAEFTWASPWRFQSERKQLRFLFNREISRITQI